MINGLCKRKTIAMPYDFIKLIDLNAVINQYNSLLIFFCFDYHQAVFGDFFVLHNFNSYKRKVIENFLWFMGDYGFRLFKKEIYIKLICKKNNI